MKRSASKVKIHRVRRSSTRHRRDERVVRPASSTKSTANRPISTRDLRDESKGSMFPPDDASHRSKSPWINSTHSWQRNHRVDPTEFTLDVLEKSENRSVRFRHSFASFQTEAEEETKEITRERLASCALCSAVSAADRRHHRRRDLRTDSADNYEEFR